MSQHDEQMHELFGPPPAYSEYKPGEQIHFSQYGQIKSGIIIAVRAPGPAVEDGESYPTVYVVDCGEGFPAMVDSGYVIEKGE